MEVSKELLEDVKNYLDITWVDEAGDKKLSGMILRSMNYLNEITGSDLDFSVEESQRTLLFVRVKYERANALDDFRKNYLSELNQLITRERIKRYAQKKSNT